MHICKELELQNMNEYICQVIALYHRPGYPYNQTRKPDFNQDKSYEFLTFSVNKNTPSPPQGAAILWSRREYGQFKIRLDVS